MIGVFVGVYTMTPFTVRATTASGTLKGMSRGLGRVERSVLECRAAHPHASTRETARSVYRQEPTEPQMRSTRRAVQRLTEKGLLGLQEPSCEPSEASQRLRAVLEGMAASGEPFDADDVRTRFDGDDEGDREVRRLLASRPNVMAGVFAGARARGVIEPAGMIRSGRSSRKGNRHMLWMGTI